MSPSSTSKFEIPEIINSEVTVSSNYTGISKHSSIKPSPIFWILELGAFEHMTCDLNLLFNIKTLSKPIFVNIHNSQRVKVIQVRSVNIFLDFTISNVLFLPTLKFNLLSVHRLSQLDDSILIFSQFYAIL